MKPVLKTEDRQGLIEAVGRLNGLPVHVAQDHVSICALLNDVELTRHHARLYNIALDAGQIQ